MEMEEIDNDEISDALSLIDRELEAKKKSEVAVAKPKEEVSIDDITNLAVESYNDIVKHSKEIYDALYAPVATRQDRSDSSKETLIESQRIKIESINALASLANAKAKLISAQNKTASGNVGVFIGGKSGNDVGINLEALKD